MSEEIKTARAVEITKHALEIFPGAKIIITTPDREATSAEFVGKFKSAGLTGIWRVKHAKQQTSPQ